MPSTLLFALNSEGRVFGLSSNGTKWREFVYLGLEFKQLSAVPNFLWAVACDRQIYVHAHGLDIPIRVKEEAYENERWTPFDGFSNRLLPTDRYNFSNHDGTVDRSLKQIRLPSMAWQWEGDWKLELTLNGQPLDHDGWSYAVDFPATYYTTMQWNSYVRRRKWVRYRKYIALNSWCAIAPLHKDPTKEPFIGVAVGGNHLPGVKDGTMLVWAVTAFGRVMFRTDVSSSCPEGKRWSSVSIPTGLEVTQISVGATGLVWVVLQSGKALARIGITRECLRGNSWTEVEPPEENLSLQQISIGHNSLWAVTKDSRVWFRKGINGELSGFSECLAKGTGWIEMCGNMTNISVSPNDQVWAVGACDGILYFRTSVTKEDLMGKTWRPLGAPTQLSRATSSTNLTSGEFGTTREKRHRSWTSLNRYSGIQEIRSGVTLDLNETCHSAPTITTGNHWQKSSKTTSATSSSTALSSTSSDSFPWTEDKSESSNRNPMLNIISEVKEYSTNSCGETTMNSYENVSHPVCAFVTKEVAIPTRSWSPQHAGGSVVAAEAHNAADSTVFESDELAGIYSEHGEREDEDDHLYWTDSEAFWSTVEAGACLVNINYLPKWFTESSENKKVELVNEWRTKILNELKGRLPSDFPGLDNYERAIDGYTWLKEGRCKCLLRNESNFRDCLIELRWVSFEQDVMDFATLTLSINKDETWVHVNISMSELTSVIGCSVPRHPRLTLNYGSRNSLKLEYTSEDEYEEWKSELSEVCRRIKDIPKIPSSNSIWVTTSLGDIFACDLNHVSMRQRSTNSDNDLHSIEETFTSVDVPIEIPLRAGLALGTHVTILGCVRDKAKRFAVDFICSYESGLKDVAFHLNARFDECQVVLNTRLNSVWGEENRSRTMPFQIGKLFKLDVCCTGDSLNVSVDDTKFMQYLIPKKPDGDGLISQSVTHLQCSGDFTISKITYSSKELIFDPRYFHWQQIEGHLKRVESAGGITWGIGFNNTAWLYVGDKFIANQMRDIHHYYVYENQRWNPLIGYTSPGLPTDRFMWSDVTGKHKRNKENTILLSKKWRWVNDWTIDFHPPGGADKEGWQYAVDFPLTYHDKMSLTDYVRRRRWFRCAELEIPGPWVELGLTPISECSLYSDGKEVTGWAVAANGSVLYRKGLSKICPAGTSWEHVSIDEQVISISCGSKQVWVVGKSGAAFCRIGITASNPIGDAWETIKAPPGTSLKQVVVGENGIWALDVNGRLSSRADFSTAFPMGSHWRPVPSLSDDPSGSDEWCLPGTSSEESTGFRQIATNTKLWGVTNSGRLVYRLGVNSDSPTGCSWMFGAEENILHTSG